MMFFGTQQINFTMATEKPLEAQKFFIRVVLDILFYKLTWALYSH